MSHSLGIDLGTSAVKVLLVTQDQQIVAQASVPIAVNRRVEGWSEQDPGIWIDATDQAIGQIRLQEHGALAAVRSIGLSGQMHGAVLLDRADQVLRPAILWNDTRSHLEAAELDANAAFRRVTGNIVFPGFTAPKINWCRAHEPEVYRQVGTVLLPKDYLRLWLTGEKITDPSDASGTAWLDVGRRQWSAELLAASGLTDAAMPRLVEGNAPGGQLRSDLLQRWGMSGPVIVAGGAGDNAAAACALGTINDNSAFVSLGSSGVLFAANRQFTPAPASAVHSFCHALPQTWHQMGVILSAADALSWFGRVVGKSPAELTAEVGEEPIVPGAMLFLPYLSGERTPHNESRPLGTFVGLSHRHDRRAMTAAVLTGVSFALRDCLMAMQSTGTSMTSVLAVGGGSRSTTWLQTIANALQIPVHSVAQGDAGAALGAARLGIAAVMPTDQSIFRPPAIERVFEPATATVGQFSTAYEHYRQLYPALANWLGHDRSS